MKILECFCLLQILLGALRVKKKMPFDHFPKMPFDHFPKMLFDHIPKMPFDNFPKMPFDQFPNASVFVIFFFFLLPRHWNACNDDCFVFYIPFSII